MARKPPHGLEIMLLIVGGYLLADDLWYLCWTSIEMLSLTPFQRRLDVLANQSVLGVLLLLPGLALYFRRHRRG